MLGHLWQDDVPVQAGSEVGGSTEIHPVGVMALAALAALTMLVPRRWCALPIILLLCFIPAGQRVVIATVDFTFVRLLMMVVWSRLFLRRDLRPLVWNNLDRAMLVWAVVMIVTGTLLGWTLSIFVNRVGVAVDTLMVYFFFRLVIRSHRDLAAIALQFTVSSFAVAVFFLVEKRTGRNMFAMFGGVPAITDVRDGRLRCQGAFAHAILAGCFWACLIPYYAVIGFLRQRWGMVVAASGAALFIVAMCASSTPVMALLFGIAGGATFLIRGGLRWLRWLILSWLAVLHFIMMKQPVWHLLARVDVVGGSTGWHRFHLVDKFFAFFHEWWLVGTLRTGHWGPGLHDVTNQFVSEGVGGGVWRLAAFVAIVWYAFAGVSRSMRVPEAGRTYLLCSWALGTALFMHCMNFIAVTYFEQIVVEWNMALAAIGSLTLVPGAPVSRQLASLTQS
ncbi:MAG: hypothetical protein H6835_10590 [Planctomycetes bacterium]|nr:hypothetical protein [Planctomycetota bacterium]